MKKRSKKGSGHLRCVPNPVAHFCKLLRLHSLRRRKTSTSQPNEGGASGIPTPLSCLGEHRHPTRCLHWAERRERPSLGSPLRGGSKPPPWLPIGGGAVEALAETEGVCLIVELVCNTPLSAHVCAPRSHTGRTPCSVAVRASNALTPVALRQWLSTIGAMRRRAILLIIHSRRTSRRRIQPSWWRGGLAAGATAARLSRR